MPAFSIDIENAAGIRQGTGPIRTASSITGRTRLDQAGEVSFTMPASDPQGALFVPNTLRYVRASAMRGSSRVNVARGLAKQFNINTESRTREVSGPDLLGELSHYHVGKLTLESAPGAGLPMAVASVLGAILAFLPGWTVTGTPSRDVYYKFGDESVLAAFGKVKELTGDHWRLSDTVERQIEWLPTTAAGFVPVSSNLRAVDIGEGAGLQGNLDVCIIVGGLQPVYDAYERITRVYLRGGGNGDAQLYINGTTRVSSGDIEIIINALNPDRSYIRSISAETDGTMIEGVITLRDIAPITTSATDLTSAANELVDAGIVQLRQRLVEQESFKLTVTKVHKPLRVGDSIHVTSRQFTDGYGWSIINKPMLMLEVSATYETGEGEPEYDIQVTQVEVDRWPVSGTQRILNSVQSVQQTASHTQTAQRAVNADAATLVNDTDVMRLSGVQTVTGDKTFTGAVTTTDAWNEPHLRMGDYHIWIDALGRLRIKNAAPTSDTDGVVVGTQV